MTTPFDDPCFSSVDVNSNDAERRAIEGSERRREEQERKRPPCLERRLAERPSGVAWTDLQRTSNALTLAKLDVLELTKALDTEKRLHESTRNSLQRIIEENRTLRAISRAYVERQTA